MTRIGILIIAAACTFFGARAEDFSFVHISDTHFNPHHANSPPAVLRAADSFPWLAEQTRGVIKLPFRELEVPAPSFGIVTGDLFEYGVIDDTWEQYDRAFADLPYPMKPVTGNHDNTWHAIYADMRRTCGGENYSWDQHGCHFIALSSASPQEPLPSFDAKTRAWLKDDLSRVAKETPIFIAFHHPMDDTTLAPAEYDTMIDLLRDHNVALLLYGHGHSVRRKDHDGIEGVMGGSTFGGNTGFGVVSLKNGRLRYHYRFKDEKREGVEKNGGWKAVYRAKLAEAPARRLFKIASPTAHSVVRRGDLDVQLEFAGDLKADTFETFAFTLDGAPISPEKEEGGRFSLKSADAKKGWHWLTVRGRLDEKTTDLRTVAFVLSDGETPWKWRATIPAALKAAPVIVDDLVIASCNDGKLIAVDRTTGEKNWAFETGGEILGTPTWAGEVLVFGSGDGHVYAVDRAGKQIWKHNARNPVYGSPVVADGVVYIGDNGGYFHALDLKTGAPRWKYDRADFSIEQQACVVGDNVVFGAWDGYLHAVNRRDGSRAWKVWGPKSAEGGAARYYAPADCGPVMLGDKLYVCDRGYWLGEYDRDGKLLGKLDENVAAIAADDAGQRLFVRGLDDRVCCFNLEGKKLWEVPVPTGRLPVPPTVAGENLLVCGNAGELSVLNAATGELKASLITTPGFYVMAPIAYRDGIAYVAGMDGSLTAIEVEKIALRARD
ncbi:MAG: PQQ-binding-like beta-propeller repeat protein [Phycisphaerae bacterium]